MYIMCVCVCVSVCLSVCRSVAGALKLSVYNGKWLVLMRCAATHVEAKLTFAFVSCCPKPFSTLLAVAVVVERVTWCWAPFGSWVREKVEAPTSLLEP